MAIDHGTSRPSLEERLERADRWRADARDTLTATLWGFPGLTAHDVGSATRRLVRASRLLNALAVKSTDETAR